MVAGKFPFLPKPITDKTNTSASMDSPSIESSPTSTSAVEFQETHCQKRKLSFTGSSCQDHDQNKRIKFSFTSHQNLPSSPDVISIMPPSYLRLFGTNIVVPTDETPPPLMNSDQTSSEYKLSGKSLDMGDGKNIPKSDYEGDQSPFFTLLKTPSSSVGKPTETQDLSSRMPSSLRLFGANIVVPTPPLMISDQISSEHKLLDESLDMGDGKNIQNSDNEDDQSPFFTLLEIPSSTFGKPTETRDLISIPNPIPSPPANLYEVSTKLSLLDESWDKGYGKINLAKFKGKLDHAAENEEVSTELKLCNESCDRGYGKINLSEFMSKLDHEEEVSTELKLYDESWDMGYGKINLLKLKGKLDREEEIREVSTDLKLQNDPWEIKKKLTKSDCSFMCRLVLPKNELKRYLKQHMEKKGITDEEIKSGIYLRVWDYDSETEHLVVFKKWDSNCSYIFGRNWRREFVERRGLQEDDEIGLFWEEHKFRFGFRVLSRANN